MSNRPVIHSTQPRSHGANCTHRHGNRTTPTHTCAAHAGPYTALHKGGAAVRPARFACSSWEIQPMGRQTHRFAFLTEYAKSRDCTHFKTSRDNWLPVAAMVPHGCTNRLWLTGSAPCSARTHATAPPSQSYGQHTRQQTQQYSAPSQLLRQVDHPRSASAAVGRGRKERREETSRKKEKKMHVPQKRAVTLGTGIGVVGIDGGTQATRCGSSLVESGVGGTRWRVGAWVGVRQRRRWLGAPSTGCEGAPWQR